MGIGQFILHYIIHYYIIHVGLLNLVTRRFFQESKWSRCIGGLRSTPDPARGVCSTLPDAIAGLSKRRGGREEAAGKIQERVKGVEGREREKREGKTGGEGRKQV